MINNLTSSEDADDSLLLTRPQKSDIGPPALIEPPNPISLCHCIERKDEV